MLLFVASLFYGIYQHRNKEETPSSVVPEVVYNDPIDKSQAEVDSIIREWDKKLKAQDKIISDNAATIAKIKKTYCCDDGGGEAWVPGDSLRGAKVRDSVNMFIP